MPLPRAALYGQGTELHVAIWPGSERLTEDITRYYMSMYEYKRILKLYAYNRFIAREGRIFCLSVGGVLREEDITECVPQYKVVREQL